MYMNISFFVVLYYQSFLVSSSHLNIISDFLIIVFSFVTGMFDKTNSDTINFESFGNLWKYVTDWQQSFRGFDKDGSNSINKSELQTALTAFGYRY